MIATDKQVQQFVDQRIRVRAEQIRNLAIALADDISSIDDIYSALTQQNPTWSDDRTDGPPHLLLASDVLAMNALYHDLLTAITGNGQYPIAQKACVRSIANT